jgi:hypothetical protein
MRLTVASNAASIFSRTISSASCRAPVPPHISFKVRSATTSFDSNASIIKELNIRLYSCECKGTRKRRPRKSPTRMQPGRGRVRIGCRPTLGSVEADAITWLVRNNQPVGDFWGNAGLSGRLLRRELTARSVCSPQAHLKLRNVRPELGSKNEYSGDVAAPQRWHSGLFVNESFVMNSI